MWPGVLFLVWFNNFEWTTGFYWSPCSYSSRPFLGALGSSNNKYPHAAYYYDALLHVALDIACCSSRIYSSSGRQRYRSDFSGFGSFLECFNHQSSEKKKQTHHCRHPMVTSSLVPLTYVRRQDINLPPPSPRENDYVTPPTFSSGNSTLIKLWSWYLHLSRIMMRSQSIEASNKTFSDSLGLMSPPKCS